MFLRREDIQKDYVPMGLNEFFSSAEGNHPVPAEHTIVVRATIQVGKGHNFHLHEDREEFIYVLEGQLEQWIGQEKQICKEGDIVFIPPGEVHASFNIGQIEARILAIFGPLSADAELTTDVSDKHPWANLRQPNI